MVHSLSQWFFRKKKGGGCPCPESLKALTRFPVLPSSRSRTSFSRGSLAQVVMYKGTSSSSSETSATASWHLRRTSSPRTCPATTRRRRKLRSTVSSTATRTTSRRSTAHWGGHSC